MTAWKSTLSRTGVDPSQIMTAPPITGLKSDIVPHRAWPLRQWFHGSGGRFYHRLHTRRSFEPGPQFYRQVDPELRELCRLLHGRGLCTTPSCQGHFHGKAYFEQRWEELRREAAAITRGGLPVKDSETDREYLFRDPNYRSPWDTFESFYRDSILHQSTGYLGILIPLDEQALYERFRSSSRRFDKAETMLDKHVSRQLGMHLYHILMHLDDPEDRARQWRRVTDWVSDKL